MRVWPRDLIGASSVRWRLDNPTTDGGETLGAVPRTPFLAGGPFWRLELEGLVLRGRDPILAGRALQVDLIGGRPLLVRPCDCRHTPLEAGLSYGAAPVSAGAPFGDVLEDESAPIVATVSAAPLRAVTLTLAMIDGWRPIIGGEQLGINHPTWGPRMYRIAKRTGGTDAAPQVRIWPPLREAVLAGAAVDFNRPGLLMQLDGALQLEPDLARPRSLNRGRVAFVELPRPPEVAEL